MTGIPLAYVATLVDGQTCHLLIDAQPEENYFTGAILDALVLHELEQLTQSLENAFRYPLVWKAIPPGSWTPEKDQLELNLAFDKVDLVRYAKFVLPQAVLFELKNLQIEDLQNQCRMSWSSIPATLVLSEFTLTDQEIDNLGDGALVLITESFQPQWKAMLVAGQDVLLGGYFSLVDNTWQRSPAAESATATVTLAKDSDGQEAEHSLLELDSRDYRLELMCRVDPRDLMKTDAAVNVNVLDSASDATISLVNHAGAAFKGHLLPAGTGQAILLEPIDVTVC